MFQLLLLQVWTQLLPGSGGEVRTPVIEPKVHYELSISGVIDSNLIGKQFDALFIGDAGNFQTPHTFVSMTPLLGEPIRKDAATHSYVWEVDGDKLSGNSIIVRAAIVEGLSSSPMYSGAFSPDAWSKGMVGNFEVKLSPMLGLRATGPVAPPKSEDNSLWYALVFFAALFPTLIYLMRRPVKLSEHGALAIKVNEAASALAASAKKRPQLQLDNILRDALQTSQELMRAGEHAIEFVSKIDLKKIESEESDFLARAEKADDEETKKTLQDVAQEKGKIRASVEEAKRIIERTKARLLRLSASLESTRVSIEAPTQNQKADAWPAKPSKTPISSPSSTSGTFRWISHWYS
jgi:hypothetical protein